MAPKLPATPPSNSKPLFPPSSSNSVSRPSGSSPYLSSTRARSGTLISLDSSSNVPPNHPSPSRPAATLQLLNPSATPYTALTPPIDIPSDPFNVAPAALNPSTMEGTRTVGSAHTLKTLAGAREARFFDEYDEDEVDRRRFISRSSSASSLALPGSGARSRAGSAAAEHVPTVRALPAARPRSASTVIDITPFANGAPPPSTTTTTGLSPPNSRPHLSRNRSSSAASITSVSSNFSGLHVGGRTSTLRQAGGLKGLWMERPLLRATMQAIGLMLVCAFGIGVCVWWMLPPVDEGDREKVRIPTSFEQLKELNVVLQVYKTRHYWRVLGSFCLIYLFLQTFSLPGSMYLSILSGAMYGVAFSLPLVCLLVATGALFCYTLSSVLGQPFLVHSATWRSRLERWRVKVSGRTRTSDLFSYLVVLRISPLPPHWVVNLLAPHLGIPRGVFWLSTFFGIAGISLIHVQIGTTLDSMTGPEDFDLFSARNLLALGGIAVAVMVPVALRWYWRGEIQAVSTDDDGESLGSRRPATTAGGRIVIAATPPSSTSRPPSHSRNARSTRASSSINEEDVKENDFAPSTGGRVSRISEEEDSADERSIIGHASILSASTEATDEDGAGEEGEEDPLAARRDGEVERLRLLGSPIKVRDALGGAAGRASEVRVPEGKAARILGVEPSLPGRTGRSRGRG